MIDRKEIAVGSIEIRFIISGIYFVLFFQNKKLEKHLHFGRDELAKGLGSVPKASIRNQCFKL